MNPLPHMPSHRTTASVLRLREAPIDGAIMNRLPRGTDLDLLQGPTKGWARVRANVSVGRTEGRWSALASAVALPRSAIVGFGDGAAKVEPSRWSVTRLISLRTIQPSERRVRCAFHPLFDHDS